MKMLLKITAILALTVLAFSACGRKDVTLVGLYKPNDYQQYKNTLYIKLHWNLNRPDASTVVADGYVEPFSPRYGVHAVRLELVGLDENGKVVNKASGAPADDNIVSPLDTSPFRITMKRNGREKEFTIRGEYYHYIAGTTRDFGSRQYDTIPLKPGDE